MNNLNLLFYGLFIFLFVCLPSCLSNTGKPPEVRNDLRLKSALEKRYPMWLSTRELNLASFHHELTEVQSDIPESPTKAIPGVSLGQPMVDKSFGLYQRVGKNSFRKSNGACQECFNNDVTFLGDSIVRGVLINFYAPKDILPIYDCPEDLASKSASSELQSISNCIPYLAAFAKENHNKFLDTTSSLQAQAFFQLSQPTWNNDNINIYMPGPKFFIERSSGSQDFNRFTSNLTPVWIEKGIVMIVKFCPSRYGTYHPIEEDYFSNIKEYQNEKKQFILVSCLITSIAEAKSFSYVNVLNFAANGDPYPTAVSHNSSTTSN